MRRLCAPLVAAVAATVLLAGPAGSTPPTWHFQVLDRAPAPAGATTFTGIGNSALLYAGRPHAFYYGYGKLRHRWWTGTRWLTEILDGAGGPDGRVSRAVGFRTASAVVGDAPHVWYYDQTGGTLRHAWWAGAKWRFETLDGLGGRGGRVSADVGDQPSVAVAGGRPHVFYVQDVAREGDPTHALRHGWWTGSAWWFETLDRGTAPMGAPPDTGAESSAVSIGGRPHVWYADVTNAVLRHAWYTATGWEFEVLDGAGGPDGRVVAGVGLWSSTVLVAGRPHVWYYDGAHGDLRHAWWTGQRWRFETLDGAGGRGGRHDADDGLYTNALLVSGRPHVFYHEDVLGALRHGWWDGTLWRFETLDGHSSTGGRTPNDVALESISSVLFAGRPHVFYVDGDDDLLRHAWYG